MDSNSIPIEILVQIIQLVNDAIVRRVSKRWLAAWKASWLIGQPAVAIVTNDNLSQWTFPVAEMRYLSEKSFIENVRFPESIRSLDLYVNKENYDSRMLCKVHPKHLFVEREKRETCNLIIDISHIKKLRNLVLRGTSIKVGEMMCEQLSISNVRGDLRSLVGLHTISIRGVSGEYQLPGIHTENSCANIVFDSLPHMRNLCIGHTKILSQFQLSVEGIAHTLINLKIENACFVNTNPLLLPVCKQIELLSCNGFDLSGCPAVENLTIYRCELIGGLSTIQVRRLKILNIRRTPIEDIGPLTEIGALHIDGSISGMERAKISHLTLSGKINQQHLSRKMELRMLSITTEKCPNLTPEQLGNKLHIIEIGDKSDSIIRITLGDITQLRSLKLSGHILLDAPNVTSITNLSLGCRCPILIFNENCKIFKGEFDAPNLSIDSKIIKKCKYITIKGVEGDTVISDYDLPYGQLRISEKMDFWSPKVHYHPASNGHIDFSGTTYIHFLQLKLNHQTMQKFRNLNCIEKIDMLLLSKPIFAISKDLVEVVKRIDFKSLKTVNFLACRREIALICAPIFSRVEIANFSSSGIARIFRAARNAALKA